MKSVLWRGQNFLFNHGGGQRSKIVMEGGGGGVEKLPDL